jgi:MFS family permease
MSSIATAPGPWYGTLTRTQWKTLLAANLGWMFDGYETFALILTVGVALRQLLDPAQYPQIPAYAGTIIAITLLGWGVGGIVGGIFADYLGRRRTMIYAILAYSLVTGLSALAWDWVSFAALRFLVGVAIGSEWSTGASITAEVWPDQARGKGAGLMQCGLGLGFFLASLVWLFISPLGPGSWRIMFVLGVLPALFVLWIRSGIPESEPWERTDESRKLAQARLRLGATLGTEEKALTRFTLHELFADPQSRRHAMLVFLLSLTTTLAWWGISTWVPPYIGSVAAKAGLPAQQWASYAGMTYNFGAVLGYASFGFLSDRLGR